MTRRLIAVAVAERSSCLRGVRAGVLGALVIVAAAGCGGPSSAKGAGAHLARNGLIAYESDINSRLPGSAEGVDVYVMNPDGSHKRQLTHTENSGEPRWSSDGRRIVFVRGGCNTTACQAPTPSALWLMNANGSDQRRLTSGRSTANDPRWSPDGRRIAFTRGTSCTGDGCKLDLWLIRPDGTGARRLTRDGRSSSPTWSPDGKKIAFSCDSPDGSRSDICVMSANGTRRRNLTPGLPASAASADQPAWSPDGRTIVFADNGALVFMSAPGYRSNLAVFRASGGDDVSEPAWSPDGSKLVLQRQQTIEMLALQNGSIPIGKAVKGKTVAFDGDNHNPDWQPLPQKG